MLYLAEIFRFGYINLKPLEIQEDNTLLSSVHNFIQWIFSIKINTDDGSFYLIAMKILYSFISLLMWLRLLYYFRIDKRTSYYIRMIKVIIAGMGQFFFIFLVSVLAFTQANYVLVSGQFYDDEGNIKPTSVFDTFIMTYRSSISDL